MSAVGLRWLRVSERVTLERWDASPDGVTACLCGWALRPRTALYALDRPRPPIGNVAVTYRDGRIFVMSAPMADADRRYGMRVVETRLDGGA